MFRALTDEKQLSDRPNRHRSVGLVLTVTGLVLTAGILTVWAPTLKSREISAVSETTASDLRRAYFAASEDYARSPEEGSLNRLIGAAYAAGQFEAVLRLTSDPEAPFADETVRRVADGEARLRLQQYDLAVNAIAPESVNGTISSVSSFFRARAQYAADPSTHEASIEGIRTALGADSTLAGEAWMFRAGIALDTNDMSTARSAAKRALEAGVDANRVEAVETEAAIRGGDLRGAALSLEARRNNFRNRIDPEAHRLAGMLAFNEGRYKDAAREFDLIDNWLQMEPRGDLMRAAAKFAAGETAQARSLAAAYRVSAPGDWVAADLSTLIAADTHEDLRRLNRPLAEARQFITSRRAADIDEAIRALDAYAAATTAVEGRPVTGLEFLFGASDEKVDAAAPTSVDWRSLMLTANAKMATPVLVSATDLATTPVDAIDLLLAARIFLKAGEKERGLATLSEAAKLAPHSIMLLREYAAAQQELGSAHAASFVRQRALDENPNLLAVRLDLAASLERAGRLGAALRVLLDGAPATLSHDDVAPVAARLAARLEDKKAIDALKDQAASIRSRQVRAEVFLILGEPERAADDYRRLLITDPGDEKAAGKYLETMTLVGRQEQAQAFLRQMRLARPESARPLSNDRATLAPPS